VLAGYGAVVLVAVWFLIVETRPAERRQDAGHSTLRQRYKAVVTDRVFVGIAIVGGMTFSGLFAYLSASPFLFQQVYEFDAQEYGLLFAVNSLGVVFGVQASARLTKYFGPEWILAVTTVGMLVLAIVIVVLDMASGGLWGVLIPLWFFIACCGFSFPCIQVLGLNSHPNEAGTAASLLGAVNFGMAGIISPIVGVLGVSNAIPMGAVMVGTSLIAVLSLWFLVRPRTVPPLTN
jgi:MFS transporter, DHA1 family, multidrug resistance protein